MVWAWMLPKSVTGCRENRLPQINASAGEKALKALRPKNYKYKNNSLI
jgi:hypothetical protein